MNERPGTPETDSGSAPDTGASPEPVADQGRRRFFRDFAGEFLQTAATVAGAASVLQRSSIAAANALLDPDGTAEALGAGPGAGAPLPAGFRTAFRFESDAVLMLVDQRAIPAALIEYEVRSAGHAAYAIRHQVIQGGQACAQAAAIGLALSAHGVREASPAVARATLKAAASAIKIARPPLRPVGRAIDRLMDLYGRLADDGAATSAIAAALRAEADRIVAEATVDNGRIAEFAAGALPDTGESPLRILTHGTSGALAGGQFGTALGAIQVLQHAGRPLHVWVSESRPTFSGSRITAWELQQAGVPHTVVADVAAGHLLATGEVDAVLIGAERVAVNGDLVAAIGSYSLAVLAKRHGVPFLPCAPLTALDPDAPDGSAIALERRPERELIGPYVAPAPTTMPAATTIRNDAFDVTPTDLVERIVTDEGVLVPPFGASLASAAAARAERWAAATGAEAVA